MIQTLKTNLNAQDILAHMYESFPHPGTVLWRSVEIYEVMKNIGMIPLWHPMLDIGCGEGEIAKEVFGKHFVDYGIDNWPEMITKAKKSGVYKNIVFGDARNMPFKVNTFNVVFSNSVIEHIPGIDKVVSEASRVLKKGGYFIFTVPNDNMRKYLFFTVFFNSLHLSSVGNLYQKKRNLKLNHYNLLSHKEWEELLEKNQLKIVKIETYLTKRMIMLWDLLTFTFFILKPTEKILLLAHINQLLKQALTQTIKGSILDNMKSVPKGASTLIIAKKV